MSRGSLRDVLNNEALRATISLETRIKIALGIAQGLKSLQNDQKEFMVVHLDLKSSNILLNENYKAKISDLGLAVKVDREKGCGKKGCGKNKICEKESGKNDANTHAHHTGEFPGTLGYIAPHLSGEYLINEKNDVFALGVIIFELLTAKKPTKQGQSGNNKLADQMRIEMNSPASQINPMLLDSKRGDQWVKSKYQMLSQLARECINKDHTKIPSIDQVVERLESLDTKDIRECCICFDNSVNAKLQCSHAVLCSCCAEQLKKNNIGCPICRVPITTIEYGFYNKSFIN
jgi:serine/threonine protein kinase